MIALAEHQFELLPNEASTAGTAFGINLNVSVDEAGFDPGEAEWLTQDGVNEIRGSTAMGRDVLQGPTWTWSMFVNRDDIYGALDSLAELRKSWRADDVAGTPGALSIVRYRIADRVRRVYGRPRRWAAPPNNLILSGMIPVTASFKTVDSLHYDDTLGSTSIAIADLAGGGMTFPVTFPINSLPSGQRSGQISVGGDTPTYPVIRFNGPITNPALLCGSEWKLQLNGEIADGSYVEIDTRPWKLSVLRNGSYSAAGMLARQTRLAKILLRPGLRDLSFQGQSVEGTSTCVISWRAAYASL